MEFKSLKNIETSFRQIRLFGIVYTAAWFWRFDRLYESKGVKAVYLRTMGLEIDSMQLVALIRRMKEADVPGRIELLNGCLLK